MSFDLPFGIDFVVEQDLSNQKGFKKQGASNNSFNIDCPFCGGHFKLNVNVQKGLFRCAKCSESGNAISLHAKLLKIDNKKAYQDLKKRYNGLPVETKIQIKNKVSSIEEPKYIPAPLMLRDFVYNELLEELELSKFHKENLLKRGLSEEQIEHFKYRSFPQVGSSTIAKKIIFNTGVTHELVKHDPIYQIPGFYDFGDKVRMVKRKQGILIPVVTRHGKISGFQIRFNDLSKKATQEQIENFKRYSWFSSTEKETGVSITGIENVHYVGFDFESKITPEVVNITEGCLKADIAYALSGKPFISLMGVSNQGQLKEELVYLKEHGTKQINICFDMDYRDKPEVKKALTNVIEKITNVGLSYQTIKWPSDWKGIDDFLLARKLAQN